MSGAPDKRRRGGIVAFHISPLYIIEQHIVIFVFWQFLCRVEYRHLRIPFNY
jgi:hypothetical protein